jgi:predicted phage terminase large subunit-like protein
VARKKDDPGPSISGPPAVEEIPLAQQLRGLSLLDFIPRISPEFSSPYHLADWCAIIERCLTEAVRALVSVPIRHFKTETTLHGIAWLLVHNPTLKIVLFTYDHERAEYLGRRTRQICEAAGIGPERDWNKQTIWQNSQGGGVSVMSAKQSKLGQDCDILFFDDPVNEHGAFDLRVRTEVDTAIAHYTARAGRPGRPGSVLGIMSRWHPDDPAGRRLLREASVWEEIRHPAIVDEDGPDERAFAPNVMTLEDLKRRRAELRELGEGERLWQAQFQNNPQPDVLGLFGNPSRYAIVPSFGRWAFGIDLAYSVEASSDFFALVVMKIWEGRAYVVEAHRERRDLDMAAQRLLFALRQYPGAAIFSYISGPEKGAIQYLIDRGVNVEAMPARYDKGTRARKTIDAWNAGRIMLPEQAPWVNAFVSRCRLFTGNPKAGDDDEIDALVSGCDGALFSGGFIAKTFGKPRI